MKDHPRREPRRLGPWGMPLSNRVDSHEHPYASTFEGGAHEAHDRMSMKNITSNGWDPSKSFVQVHSSKLETTERPRRNP